MSNLLEKASILLTPTAYDDGKILSVKPEPSLGSELITNGDFATDTDWTKGTGWTIGGGVATANNVPNLQRLQQGLGTSIIGSKYKYSINISNVSGFYSVYIFGVYVLATSNTEGIIEGEFTATSTNGAFWVAGASASGLISATIDNVSVKEAIDGDFDFTRNSSATRVNSQGLIEDMQILSGNLVSNGDFSQEGAEQVTNGDFATDSDWSLQSGWSISDNSLIATNVDIFRKAFQTLSTKANTYYQVNINVEELGSSIYVFFESTTGDQYKQITSVGTHTFTILSPIINSRIFIENADNSNPNIKINNVSVKEVGQDWTVSSSASVGENKLNVDASAFDFFAIQTALTNGLTYKVTLDAEVTTGDILLYTGTQFATINSSDSYTFYTTSNSAQIRFRSGGSGFEGSITNISVIEITDDTNLPRINYEGFSYQDSLGSELVTNGDFSNGSAGWSVSNGTITDKYNASLTSYQNGIRITPFIKTGTFKVTFDLVVTSGSCKFVGGGSNEQTYSTSGAKEIIVINPSRFEFNAFNLGWVGTLDNVSVKEYLGQEPIPDSGCGSWLFEPQSTNLLPYSEDFSTYPVYTGASIQQNYSTSPDGLQNATKLNFSAHPFSRIEQTIPGSFASQTHTVSLWARCASNTEAFRLKCTNRGYVDYYSENKTATTQWQKFSFSATFGSTSGDIGAAIANSTDAQERSIEIFGFQVEANKSYATSYIPTNGSTVTRLKDAAFGSGNSDLINSTEGVLYFEGSALTNETDVNKTIGISNVSSSNRVQLTLHGTPSRISFYGTSSEGFALSYSNFSYNKTEPLKIAVKWKIGDVGIFINGIKVYTGTPANTFLSNTLNTLSFADYNNVGSPFYGKTKCLAVFKEALTDEELECLTTDETSYSSFTALALANNYTII